MPAPQIKSGRGLLVVMILPSRTMISRTEDKGTLF
jgi:hypothetical protein